MSFHNDTTCPSCDGDQYDDAAGYCAECGFEGFDGDQRAGSIARRLVTVMLGAVMALAGCGGGGDDNSCLSYTVNNTQPIVGATGLTLAPSQDVYMSFRQIEDLYQEVKQCTGIHPTTGPTVYYKNFSQNNLGAAWAFQTSNVIWINTDAVNLIAPRNCHSDRQALKHEFVHYLLYMSGTDIVQNAGHDSALFAKCDAVGVRTENGVPY